MSKIDIVRFLAIVDKMQIESQPNLSREEKELFKQMVDSIKKQAEMEYNQQKDRHKS